MRTIYKKTQDVVEYGNGSALILREEVKIFGITVKLTERLVEEDKCGRFIFFGEPNPQSGIVF